MELAAQALRDRREKAGVVRMDRLTTELVTHAMIVVRTVAWARWPVDRVGTTR